MIHCEVVGLVVSVLLRHIECLYHQIWDPLGILIMDHLLRTQCQGGTLSTTQVKTTPILL